MLRSPAYIFSLLFHPAIYPLLGMLAVLKLVPQLYSLRAIYLSLSLVFVGTYLIPVLVSLLLFRLNLVESLSMNNARDRRLPYVFGAASFYFTALLINQTDLAREAYLFLLASAGMVVLHLLLLSRTKLSAHMGASGGFLGLLLALSAKYEVNVLPYITLMIVVMGITASARLSLKAHRPSEIIWGAISGLVFVFAVVYWA